MFMAVSSLFLCNKTHKYPTLKGARFKPYSFMGKINIMTMMTLIVVMVTTTTMMMIVMMMTMMMLMMMTVMMMVVVMMMMMVMMMSPSPSEIVRVLVLGH